MLRASMQCKISKDSERYLRPKRGHALTQGTSLFLFVQSCVKTSRNQEAVGVSQAMSLEPGK